MRNNTVYPLLQYIKSFILIVIFKTVFKFTYTVCYTDFIQLCLSINTCVTHLFTKRCYCRTKEYSIFSIGYFPSFSPLTVSSLFILFKRFMTIYHIRLVREYKELVIKRSPIHIFLSQYVQFRSS